MTFTVIIPARYQSERLPGKPLMDIEGQSLIQRVYHQARKSRAQRVIVATDDQRIVDHVQAFGGEVCLTSASHPSGTDRLYEACTLNGFNQDQIIVNVQGDEPLIPPDVINQVAENIVRHAVPAATLGEKIKNLGDVFNENIVKAVFDEAGYALYFSRAPLPWIRGSYNSVRESTSDLTALSVESRHLFGQSVLRHIGIYAYRTSLLGEFVQWPEAPIEKLERLEQLRILWKGYKIHIEESRLGFPQGVDTPDDLERVRKFIRETTSQ